MQGDVNVSKHLFKEKEWASKAERVLKMAARGPECWDCEFYQAENEDTQDMSCYEAFSHFVNHGQFDMDRPFRYSFSILWSLLSCSVFVLLSVLLLSVQNVLYMCHASDTSTTRFWSRQTDSL